MDYCAVNECPDLSTVMKLHNHPAVPEVFCSSYPLRRKPPVQLDVEKLPGQVYCGRSERWRTRKAKPRTAELPQMQLTMELAASEAAQAVEQHAAATDWSCISDLVHQIAWDVAPHQPTSLAHADITKGTGAVCSTQDYQYMNTSTAAATSKYDIQDSTADDNIGHEPCRSHMQQHSNAASSMQLPACFAHDSDATAHPETATDSSVANERNTMTAAPKVTRKRKHQVLTEQSGVDEEDCGKFQPETPEQGNMPREHATFRRMDHSSSEMTAFARPHVGDIVWAKVHNYKFWPAQVTRLADKNLKMLRQQYRSLTETGIHVTFFGESRSVGYAKPSDIKPFIGEDAGTSRAGMKRAVEEAKVAQRGQVHVAHRHKRQR